MRFHVDERPRTSRDGLRLLFQDTSWNARGEVVSIPNKDNTWEVVRSGDARSLGIISVKDGVEVHTGEDALDYFHKNVGGA